MGVDAGLWIPATVQPEFIVQAIGKAAGYEFSSDNVFTACKEICKHSDYYSFGMWNIQFPNEFKFDSFFNPSMFLSYEGPWVPSWHIVTKSTASKIAVLREVGKAFGGYLVYRDYDDKGEMIYGKIRQGSNPAWEHINQVVSEVQKFVATDEDEKEAAYKKGE